MKAFIIAILFAAQVFALDVSIQDKGVDVTLDNTKKISVKRVVNDKCMDFDQNAKNAWGGKYALDSIPNECKNSFINFMGYISPIKIDGVETYGELETLDFLQKKELDKENYILVDSRLESWFYTGSIPSAVNMPYLHFIQPNKYQKELNNHLEALGIKYKNNIYDFSKAKKALFFCNGIWCGQSPQAIAALLKLGYPKEKIFWYRGGMQNWRSVGLSTIIPSK